MLVLDSRYKITAIVLALVVHICIAAMIVWNPLRDSVGVAKDFGQGGIEIALADVTARPATIQKKPEPKPIEKKDAAKLSQDKPKEEIVEKPDEIQEERLSASDPQAGGGVPLTEKNYMTTLQVWLERHKKYPYQARRRNMEGTAVLYFEIDRNGNVLESYIKTSSGYRLLDDEVLAMLQRAQPLPAMPAAMKKENLILVLPVQFYLR